MRENRESRLAQEETRKRRARAVQSQTMASGSEPLANLIASARAALEPKLAQDGLARLLGVSQPTVSAWETGKTRPTLDNLVAMAPILQLDLAVLIDAAAHFTPDPRFEVASKR